MKTKTSFFSCLSDNLVKKPAQQRSYVAGIPPVIRLSLPVDSTGLRREAPGDRQSNTARTTRNNGPAPFNPRRLKFLLFNLVSAVTLLY